MNLQRLKRKKHHELVSQMCECYIYVLLNVCVCVCVCLCARVSSLLKSPPICRWTSSPCSEACHAAPDLPCLTSPWACASLCVCVSVCVWLLDEPSSLWSGVIKAERRSKLVIAVIWQRLHRVCPPIRALAWPPPAPLQSQSTKSLEDTNTHTHTHTHTHTPFFQPKVWACLCHYLLMYA